MSTPLKIGDSVTVKVKPEFPTDYSYQNEVMVVKEIRLPFVIMKTFIGVSDYRIIKTQRYDILDIHGNKVTYNYADQLVALMPSQFKIGDKIVPIDSVIRREKRDCSFLGEVFRLASINRRKRTFTAFECRFDKISRSFVFPYDEWCFTKWLPCFELPWFISSERKLDNLTSNQIRELARKSRKFII